MDAGIRINKFISNSGTCSRRDADKLISEGCVTINGITAVPGSGVHDGDVVLVNGETVVKPPDKVYIAYNKPAGVICTSDRNIKDNIIDAVGYPEKIFTVGRLDRLSTGLILLTNDGDIVNRILRAGNKHEKEYHVTVDKPVSSDFVKKMSEGIPILGTVTAKCKVRKTGPNAFTIILTQGLNRQIRRMCEYLGFEVMSLHRTRIMNIDISTLKPGRWRHLTFKELRDLRQMIAGSVKVSEAEASK